MALAKIPLITTNRTGSVLRSALRALALSACLVTLSALSFSQETPQEDPVATFNQAQDLHEKGDLAGAIKLYEIALKIEPAFPEAEYQRGLAELALGKNELAEKAFRRAIELREDWPLPMTRLGTMLLDRREFDAAEKLLVKSVELDPNNAVALSALTELRITTKAPNAALEALLAKISSLTGKANATASLWSARAALEIALMRHAEARTSVAKAVAADPKNRTALFQLAETAVADGDLAKANDVLQRLGGVGDERTRVLKASILAADGKTAEALAILEPLAAASPAAAELRTRINLSRSVSRAELEKLLEKDPKDAAILGRLCTVLRREDPEKALVYCRRAVEAEPSNANHAVGFAAALVQTKQYETAVVVLRKILETVPDNFTARANLASALFQLKRYPESRVEFEWLAAAQPRLAGPFLFLGIIYDEAGEYMDAAANYQQYLRLADPALNKLDIDKVNLRLPSVLKLIKDGKTKRSGQ